MEHALKITGSSSSHWQLVSISEMQNHGENLARSYSYRCPDKRCAVLMCPAFPQKEKHGRKKNPRPYFRASRDSHKEGCQGDGAGIRAGTASRSESKPTTSDVVGRQIDYPTRFVERKRLPLQTIAHVGNNTNSNSSEEDETGRAQHGKDFLVRGESQTGHIRKLVEKFETSGVNLGRVKLQGIPNCPGRTYATVFKPAAYGVTEDGHPIPHQYIYYGRCGIYTKYKSGYWIAFAETSKNGKPLGVWLSSDLGPETMRDSFLDRLAHGRAEVAMLYALGIFSQKFSGSKYSIELAGINRIWISYKAHEAS